MSYLKSQSCPTTRHGGACGRGIIAPTHSRPRHLMGGEWSASRPGHALAPRKGPPVPIVQEAGWASEPVWTQRLEKKSFRLCRGSNLHRLVIQRVPDTILTELPGSLMSCLHKIKNIFPHHYRASHCLIVQFSPASCHLIPPKSKHTSQHPVIKHLNLCRLETVSVENVWNASDVGWII
jgi:hypothetical protein